MKYLCIILNFIQSKPLYMKYVILLLTSLIISQSFAQTTNFIEVAVDEMIELKAESAKLQIILLSASEQEARLFSDNYEVSENEFEFGYYFNGEEDWEYEQMLESSPKMITKEMKEGYEARARQRELEEKLQQERNEERVREIAKFKPIMVSDIQTILKKINLPFKVIKNGGQDNRDVYSMYDSAGDYMDSLIEVTLSSKADWDKLNAALSELPIEQEIIDARYETPDKYYPTLIPKLTNKAQMQAEIIASSIKRKLGSVIECTNVYPYTPSKSYLRSFTGSRGIFGEDEIGNPFITNKKELIQYIYRFRLLD